MKKLLLVLSFIMAFAVSFGEEVEKEFSFFKKNPDTDVTNLRLGLIYTQNKNVDGIDINWLVTNDESNNATKIFTLVAMDEKGGEQNSIFTGINYSKGDVKGVSISFAQISKSHDGFSLATVNWATESAKGFKLGTVNYAKEMVGIQFGLFNYAEELDGYQIGLINYAKNSSLFAVLPFFNMGKM